MIADIERAFDEGPDDPIALLVLLRLAKHADADGICWPSLPHICEKTRLSESSVRRAIQKLEGGWLTVIRGRGAGNRSKYQLHRKVSDRNLSEGNLSDGNLSKGPEKGVPQAEKGVTRKNPLVPLLGRKNSKRNEQPKRFELPEWIPDDVWSEFEEMRKLRKKPLTDRARQLIARKLSEFRQEGHNPVEVIENSIVNGWQDVYRPRTESGHRGSNRPVEPCDTPPGCVAKDDKTALDIVRGYQAKGIPVWKWPEWAKPLASSAALGAPNGDGADPPDLTASA